MGPPAKAPIVSSFIKHTNSEDSRNAGVNVATSVALGELDNLSWLGGWSLVRQAEHSTGPGLRQPRQHSCVKSLDLGRGSRCGFFVASC